MSIYITRNKEKFGPYEIRDVQKLIDENIVSEMDFAWAEGEPEWVPLNKIQGLDFTREKKMVNLDDALKQARHRQETDHAIGVKPMASLGGDVRKIGENLSFTASELTKFLGEMKGKAPKEMLGMVAQSTLFKGILSSTVLFAGIILVFTAIPFTYKIFNPPEEKPVQESVSSPTENADGSDNQNQGQTTPTAGGETATTQPAATDADGNPLPTGSSGNEVIDTLGIGETKVAAPNVNPLDDTGDDILGDLE